ncbi:MAG: hypothetical protein K0R38_1580 [Polyangiaceae bacterium]|jgi:hypothetical protein|nr:hypothetical protein [Polyangiaceae bacterium]
MARYWLFWAVLGLLLGAVTARGAGAAAPIRVPWTDRYPRVEADVAAGKPLTLLVVVPLCDRKLIACGGQGAGDPGSLDKNLYWGRAFGARRYFDETAKHFKSVARSRGEGSVLEQLVYRRMVPGARWGRPGDVEQLVVLRAIHGERIDDAVRDFYRFATQGAEVTFVDQGVERRVTVHVAGYAGHNRLMDGISLQQLVGAEVAVSPPAPAALPSFVFACRSAPYFSAALREAGSDPLVMTRDLMAPEGYVIEAMARGLGDRATPSELRQRVVAAYARWQRIPERTAGTIFDRRAR